MARHSSATPREEKSTRTRKMTREGETSNEETRETHPKHQTLTKIKSHAAIESAQHPNLTTSTLLLNDALDYS